MTAGPAYCSGPTLHAWTVSHVELQRRLDRTRHPSLPSSETSLINLPREFWSQDPLHQIPSPFMPEKKPSSHK
eukprot:700439-Hanusia_phi.AAC.1